MKKLSLKLTTLLAVVAAWVGTSTIANATLVLDINGPGSPTYPVWFNFSTNPSDQQLAAALGVTTLPSDLYKSERDGNGEEGSMSGSYDVSYIPPNGEGIALITQIPGARYFDTSKLTYLLAKDGDGGHYLWNLSLIVDGKPIWDGMEDIQIANMWPNQGAFSHIDIGGTTTTWDSPQVPEPTTFLAGLLLLLPFGASAARIIRKNRS